MANSLIDELQMDASNDEVSVASLLRKALMVAAKLGVQEVPQWLNREMSGYPDVATLPEYRKVFGTVKAKTIRGWVPVQFPNTEMQEKVAAHYVREPVSEIEALLHQEGGKLANGFAPEAQSILQTLFQLETEFANFLGRSSLVGILGEIRNQVLKWAISLDVAGIRGDGLTFSNTERQRAHDMNFTVSNGNLNVGAVGDIKDRASVAIGEGARAGAITSDDVLALVSAISRHIPALELPPSDKVALITNLDGLSAAAENNPPDGGVIKRFGQGVLDAVGKAAEPILTAGITAFVKGWLSAHGIVIP